MKAMLMRQIPILQYNNQFRLSEISEGHTALVYL